MVKKETIKKAPSRGISVEVRKQPINKEDFTGYCRLLYDSGLVRGVGGNLSARAGKTIYLTPSGYSLKDVTIKTIVTVNIRGELLGGGMPTKDMEVHLGILHARPEIEVVCHVHGPYIIAASALLEPGHESLPPITPGFAYLAYPLAMLPFMVPGSKELSKSVTRHFKGSGSKALLLQNHGLITIGENFQEAFNIAEEIDEAARIWLLTGGRAKVIPKKDVKRIKEL